MRNLDIKYCFLYGVKKKMCLGEFYDTSELEIVYNISSLIQQILDFQGISQKSHPSK